MNNGFIMQLKHIRLWTEYIKPKSYQAIFYERLPQVT